MKNFENEKVLWEPVLCRHLKARYHSIAINWKCLALKIGVTALQLCRFICPLMIQGVIAWCLVADVV